MKLKSKSSPSVVLSTFHMEHFHHHRNLNWTAVDTFNYFSLKCKQPRHHSLFIPLHQSMFRSFSKTMFWYGDRGREHEGPAGKSFGFSHFKNIQLLCYVHTLRAYKIKSAGLAPLKEGPLCFPILPFSLALHCLAFPQDTGVSSPHSWGKTSARKQKLLSQDGKSISENLVGVRLSETLPCPGVELPFPSIRSGTNIERLW